MRWTTTSAISAGRGGGGAEQDLPASVIAEEWKRWAATQSLSQCRGERGVAELFAQVST